MASLERLRAENPACIYPAHGPKIEDGKAKIDEYIAHRHDRERQIVAVLENGAAHPMDIVKIVYASYRGDAARGGPAIRHPASDEAGTRRTNPPEWRRPDPCLLEPLMTHPILRQLDSQDPAQRQAALPIGCGRPLSHASCGGPRHPRWAIR